MIIILVLIVLLLILHTKLDCNLYTIDIPVYVISLKRSHDRKKHIEKELGKYKISFRYFDAVDGKNMKKEQLNLAEKYISKDANFPLVSGATGCYLSHVLLLQKLRSMKTSHTMIFEDDAHIVNFNKLTGILNLIDDYDIIFLGHCGELKGDYIKEFFSLHKSVMPRCTHGYIISYKGVCKMLDIFENNKGKQAVDHIFANSNLKNYSVHPQIVEQSGMQSTIQNQN